MSTYGFMSCNLGARTRKLEIAVVAGKHDNVRAQGYGDVSRPILELVQFHTTAKVAAATRRACHFFVSHLKSHVSHLRTTSLFGEGLLRSVPHQSIPAPLPNVYRTEPILSSVDSPGGYLPATNSRASARKSDNRTGR